MILTKNLSSAYALQRNIANTLLKHNDLWINEKCIFHQMKEKLGKPKMKHFLKISFKITYFHMLAAIQWMTYTVGHSSPLENRINSLVQQFVEHGFFNKFYDKYQMWFKTMKAFKMQDEFVGRSKQTTHTSYVTIDNLHDAILMLAIGWPLAIMVFIGELMWKRYQNNFYRENLNSFYLE